jgi:hypothetical protein
MFCTPSQANRIIESLRMGIPPDGFVRDFTVGRESEISSLRKQLNDHNLTALLLNANYGAGKTHLIRFIKEEALERNYAVSVVTLDAKNGIGFNKIGQIVRAVCQNIDIPVNFKENEADKGIINFKNIITNKKAEIDRKLLELWANGTGRPFSPNVRNLLYKLAKIEESYIIKPKFSTNIDYEASKAWTAFYELNYISNIIGLQGLIILFDEFEDILNNLRNIVSVENALRHMFDFFAGKYSVKTFFAVTPEFVNKCETHLIDKCRFDFDFGMFKMIIQFKMSPLEIESLIELGKKIVVAHGIAYNWDVSKYLNDEVLSNWLKETGSIRIGDRSRQSVKLIVSKLDAILQEDE